MEASLSPTELECTTDLKKIECLSQKNANANFAFARFLKTFDPVKIDALVKEISDEVTKQVDCTTCAKCCRALVIAPDYRDVSQLAASTELSTLEFKKKYMRTDSEGDLVFRQKPCPFLKSNRCSVYENRPKLCRKYPYLDQGDFLGTINRVLRNVHVCPIVFNTFERLKSALLNPDVSKRIRHESNARVYNNGV